MDFDEEFREANDLKIQMMDTHYIKVLLDTYLEEPFLDLNDCWEPYVPRQMIERTDSDSTDYKGKLEKQKVLDNDIKKQGVVKLPKYIFEDTSDDSSTDDDDDNDLSYWKKRSSSKDDHNKSKDTYNIRKDDDADDR